MTEITSYIEKMSNLEFSGKIKGMKTFKEYQQEHLLKATVMSVSELAKRKLEDPERAQEFTRAAADEEFVNRTERSVSPDCPTPIGQSIGIVTREPNEGQL